MPMGLVIAPPTFLHLMQLVLRGLSWKTCLIYLDDIIVYSKSFSEHIQHFREVFQRLRAANLKLKPATCSFAQPQVTCGFIFGSSARREKYSEGQGLAYSRKSYRSSSLIGFVFILQAFHSQLCSNFRATACSNSEREVVCLDCHRTGSLQFPVTCTYKYSNSFLPRLFKRVFTLHG